MLCVCEGGGVVGVTGSMVKMLNSIFVSSFIIKLFKLDGRFTSLFPFPVILGSLGGEELSP